MQIYLAHSTHYDYRKELYEPIKNSALNDAHKFIYLFDLEEFPASTKELIKTSELVVAEVSYSGIGLGIELGWADVFGKRIVCVHKPAQLASKFLGALTKEIYEYQNSEELISTLTDKL